MVLVVYLDENCENSIGGFHEARYLDNHFPWQELVFWLPTQEKKNSLLIDIPINWTTMNVCHNKRGFLSTILGKHEYPTRRHIQPSPFSIHQEIETKVRSNQAVFTLVPSTSLLTSTAEFWHRQNLTWRPIGGRQKVVQTSSKSKVVVSGRKVNAVTNVKTPQILFRPKQSRTEKSSWRRATGRCPFHLCQAQEFWESFSRYCHLAIL